MTRFDLIVLGSGPAGQRAAVQAAKLGRSVLIVEKDAVGGSCLHKGTIPSKTLREAALGLDRQDPQVLIRALARARSVIEAERAVITEQLRRNGVRTLKGCGSFVAANIVEVRGEASTERFEAKNIVIATGSKPHRPAKLDRRVHDSDTLLGLDSLPRELGIVGAGVIGCEYASIFARLGTRVTIFDRRTTLLRGIDSEILDSLTKQFQERHNITLELDCSKLDVHAHGARSFEVETQRGKRSFEAILLSLGRNGNVDELKLENAGLTANERGVIAVNSHYQTNVPHIYAVGDVQGAPSLATSAAEQGRMAAAHAFGHYTGEFPATFPYGIYTIPEISSCGLDEEAAREKGIEPIVGRARYKELARGKILGDDDGLLKLVFCRKTEKLIGAHVIGTGATELVHIGQVAIALGAKIDFFVTNVFNYPTLAEAYKVAGYAAFNQFRALREEKAA